MYISEFPIGNTAITVSLMVGHKPGTMLLFRFEVPRDQKQWPLKFIYIQGVSG
jgi:hypothetical protein